MSLVNLDLLDLFVGAICNLKDLVAGTIMCWVPILAKILVPKFRLKWADLNGSTRFQNAEKNSWLLLNELYSNNTKSKNTNITIGSKQKIFLPKI